MNKTNKLALEAKAKAEEMGWEARVQLDQSDVLDMATVVAWKKGATDDSPARYIRFTEERESVRGWIPVKHAMIKLDYCNCY